MSTKFPSKAFGICPVCGGGGGDDEDASGADVEIRTDAESATAGVANANTTGNGYLLEWFRGELMCELCRKEILADEESIVAADKHADEEEFRAGAGFQREVT